MVNVVVGVTDEAELLEVTLGDAKRAVHEVHGVVQKERDGRVVAGDEADDALRELRLLKPRAVEAMRLWPSSFRTASLANDWFSTGGQASGLTGWSLSQRSVTDCRCRACTDELVHLVCSGVPSKVMVRLKRGMFGQLW